MIDRVKHARISKRIDFYRDEMVSLQTALTAIPAIAPESGGDGEHNKAKYLLSALRDMNFPSPLELNAPDVRVSSGFRPNIIMTIPGVNPDKTIWIMTHIDVVPPGELELWSGDPYKAYEQHGRIFGRGTEDNQQDMIASIFAAKAIIDEGITTENSIGLAFVADEETASNLGLWYVLNHKDNPFRKTDIIVAPDSGDIDGRLIEIAEKSIMWLRFKTIGKQCHASRPSYGKNAFNASSHLIVHLSKLRDIFNFSDPFFEPPTSTFEPTKKEANLPNINTIPGEDIFYMDCRVLPNYSLSDVLLEIRKIADQIERLFEVSVEICPVQKTQAPTPTPHDASVVVALQKAIKDVYHVNAIPRGIGAGTVAAVFRVNGYQAAVWSKLTGTAHQPNENCVIDNMLGNAKVFAHLFMQSI